MEIADTLVETPRKTARRTRCWRTPNNAFRGLINYLTKFVNIHRCHEFKSRNADYTTLSSTQRLLKAPPLVPCQRST